MNILLISPNTLTVPYPVYPIGLDYVAGSLDKRHRVQIADMNVMGPEELIAVLRSFAPDIVGISFRNIDNTEIDNPLYFIEEHKQLIERIRRHCQAVIVGGGAGFTILPHEIFEVLDLDYGIIGEGERFGELVESLDQHRTPTDIAGLISRTGPSDPTSPWTGSQKRQTSTRNDHTSFYLNHGGMLNLQTKRGCSFRCIYCPYPHIEGRKHRLIDPRQVARTAIDLQEQGAKYIFITDSAFNSDVSHSLEVADAFISEGLTVPWGGFFAPIILPDDYFKTMKKSGLSHVEFGTESMSESMLKNYQKPFHPDTVVAAHRQAAEADLHIAHYFLLGGPGESSATVAETIENISRLKKAAFFFFTGIRIYPHTHLYDTALKEKKISADTNLLKPLYYISDLIQHEEIETMVKQAAAKKINWIVGSGGDDSASIVAKMHERGYTGPLWEFLIR